LNGINLKYKTEELNNKYIWHVVTYDIARKQMHVVRGETAVFICINWSLKTYHIFTVITLSERHIEFIWQITNQSLYLNWEWEVVLYNLHFLDSTCLPTLYSLWELQKLKCYIATKLYTGFLFTVDSSWGINRIPHSNYQRNCNSSSMAFIMGDCILLRV
jgi:hypothetical protein